MNAESSRPAEQIPQAPAGMPEAGLQVDMWGQTHRVQPRTKARFITASMDGYAKLVQMQFEGGSGKSTPRPEEEEK